MPVSMVGTRVTMVNNMDIICVYMELKDYEDFEAFHNLCSLSIISSYSSKQALCCRQNSFPVVCLPNASHLTQINLYTVSSRKVLQLPQPTLISSFFQLVLSEPPIFT